MSFARMAAAALVAGISALGCSDGQRSCPSDFTCANLVENTCGADGACASSDSCNAAKKLQTDGNQATCEAAWCSLGESYEECE
jgi:hypothetical protein